ncbi:MAG: tetraacyldisaccharide 4'-kinase [Candidatus Accumulibacter sp.]|jgi:tetraacyldisaccharide 4'-kinase|uniref:Tetraacyldisaccharide 4'-kinase n=1 Tax=Candidatus Accumulibacter affinis TaxID=2954384 RepID=A0A935TAE6_9PROT|nr:tetraacyldisaccharide 4'-kinase [Candidatus Accumulibacter affinis]MBP9804304.1 tetraacyldisaccharide 4'-kinase [Accumulibacter sp.]
MSGAGMAQRLPGWWYQRHLVVALWPLLPLSWVFGWLVALRRWLYHCGALRSYRLPVPLVVVGNLTVGGSGKTPLVLWLVRCLRERGWRPGIISRGYGGSGDQVWPVDAAADCSLVGDEPLLLARRSGVPVFVGRNRPAAGQALLAAHPECDVIVSDDGLQHYRLQRSLELVVFDGRGVGNGRRLPAGPLRESLGRLAEVDAVVWNGRPKKRVADAARHLPQFEMRLVGERFVAANGAQRSCDADQLKGRKLHALAGIGDPNRFFRQLQALGLDFQAHPFPDHHPYRAADLAFADDGVLLMTEKDAVKCGALVSGEAWVLPVDAVITAQPGQAGLFETILEKLHGRTPA